MVGTTGITCKKCSVNKLMCQFPSGSNICGWCILDNNNENNESDILERQENIVLNLRLELNAEKEKLRKYRAKYQESVRIA